MKNIIIVDDDPSIQDSIQLIFDHTKYKVTIYGNGTEILEKGFDTPDIFILDKQLSGVDGLDLCKHLRAQEITKNIPIIMLSANPWIAKLALEAGADDAIEKPFHMRALREAVERLVG